MSQPAQPFAAVHRTLVVQATHLTGDVLQPARQLASRLYEQPSSVSCAGAEALRGAHVDLLSCVEHSHAVDTETMGVIGATAEQGAQAVQGELPSPSDY